MGSEQLLLTINLINQVSNYLIIHFVKPTGFMFNPGQYGVFKHVKEIEGRQVLPMSFISTPYEDELIVAMKLGEQDTPFKLEMLTLKKGDQMIMVGPMGSLSFDTDASSIFIAEGIGIAPLISMMKTFDDEVELIYTSNDEFLFQDEINQFNYIDAKFCHDEDETKSHIIESIRGNDESLIYILGTEKFVTSIKELLINNCIDENLIVEDNYHSI